MVAIRREAVALVVLALFFLFWISKPRIRDCNSSYFAVSKVVEAKAINSATDYPPQEKAR